MLIKLRTDNKMVNGINTIELDESTIEYELVKFFRWRTKLNHKSYLSRFYALGSYKYDSFIEYLISKYK